MRIRAFLILTLEELDPDKMQDYPFTDKKSMPIAKARDIDSLPDIQGPPEIVKVQLREERQRQ